MSSCRRKRFWAFRVVSLILLVMSWRTPYEWREQKKTMAIIRTGTGEERVILKKSEKIIEPY